MPDHVAPGARPEEVPRSAWTLLAFLTGLNILNFVDRQLIASLAPMLIAELGLTRADIGLLVGFAFVVFYTVMGMLLGVAADRFSRRALIAGGLALWSAMTAVSGAARSFLHLAVPRVFVGVGEATLTPAALSMLGDAFPPRRLGIATGIYYAGIPLGTALSLVVAGWIAPTWGWRACFYVLGGVGLVAVAGLLLLEEPERHWVATPGTAVGTRPSVGAIVSDLRSGLKGSPALLLALLGGSALVYGSASALHVITWLVHERGFPFATAAFTAGGIAVPAGFLGNLAGGWFADWGHRTWRGGRLWSLVAMTAAFAPFSAAFYMLPPSSPLFFLCWFFASASTTAYFGPVFAVVQELAPPRVRSTTVAFALLVMNLLGVGPGPWITGLIGDRSSLTEGLLASVAVSLVSVVPLGLAARLEAAGAGKGPD